MTRIIFPIVHSYGNGKTFFVCYQRRTMEKIFRYDSNKPAFYYRKTSVGGSDTIVRCPDCVKNEDKIESDFFLPLRTFDVFGGCGGCIFFEKFFLSLIQEFLLILRFIRRITSIRRRRNSLGSGS